LQATIAGGGAIPHIHRSLFPQGQQKENASMPKLPAVQKLLAQKAQVLGVKKQQNVADNGGAQ
jgi:hypothetical protein